MVRTYGLEASLQGKELPVITGCDKLPDVCPVTYAELVASPIWLLQRLFKKANVPEEICRYLQNMKKRAEYLVWVCWVA